MCRSVSSCVLLGSGTLKNTGPKVILERSTAVNVNGGMVKLAGVVGPDVTSQHPTNGLPKLCSERNGETSLLCSHVCVAVGRGCVCGVRAKEGRDRWSRRWWRAAIASFRSARSIARARRGRSVRPRFDAPSHRWCYVQLCISSLFPVFTSLRSFHCKRSGSQNRPQNLPLWLFEFGRAIGRRSIASRPAPCTAPRWLMPETDMSMKESLIKSGAYLDVWSGSRSNHTIIWVLLLFKKLNSKPSLRVSKKFWKKKWM